jgi:hypothetical protein
MRLLLLTYNELLGADKSQLASSDKLAANLGFKNIPSDIFKKKN